MALLLLVLAAAVSRSTVWRSPYQGFAGEVFVEIPRGTSHRGIADVLAAAGVVRARWDFLLARLASAGRVLQAGEYRFNQRRHRRWRSSTASRAATSSTSSWWCPEGKNMFDIAAAAEQLGRVSRRTSFWPRRATLR